jgi:hypothetical protein
MKSVLLVGLFGALVSVSYAAKAAVDRETIPVGGPESRTELTRGQERGDHHGGGGHGGGHQEGHGHVYHETYGQELFQGEEWMLLVPLLLIPLIALACYYFWGGSKGGDEGWGWDRMGYSDTSVGGAYPSTQGAYDTRSFVPADTLDKSTHQRIFDSIQQ